MRNKNKSGMLGKLQAEFAGKLRRETELARRFTMQQSRDIMLIALHEGFGFGAERLKRFGEAYDKAFTDYADWEWKN